MKFKVGDLVTILEYGTEYDGIIVEIEDDERPYYIFIYDYDSAYWYRETDLK